jgi:hypothetical protein
MDKYCRSCGAELNKPLGSHCPSCGAELAAGKEPETRASSSDPEKPRPEKTVASSKPSAPPIIQPSKEKPGSGKRTPLLIAGGMGAIVIVIIAILATGGSNSSDTGSASINVLPASGELSASTVAVVSHVPASERMISTADLTRSISRQAAQAGLKSTPTPGQPKYKETEEAALGEIFDAIWLGGQATEMGITVTKKEIADEFAQIKKKNFKTEKQYQAFLKSSHFTEADVLARVKLQILSTKIQAQISKGIKGNATAQQKGFGEFVDAYQKRWRSRTVCAAGYVIERCSNGPEPKEASASSSPPAP